MTYRHELDGPGALLASRFIKGGDPARDFAEHLDVFEEVTRLRAGGSDRYAILIVFDPGFPVPDARTRQRAATVTSASHFDPCLAVVSNSPLMRGVLTAVGWLRRHHVDQEVVSEVDQGLRWLETRRGAQLPELSRMVVRLGSSA